LKIALLYALYSQSRNTKNVPFTLWSNVCSNYYGGITHLTRFPYIILDSIH